MDINLSKYRTIITDVDETLYDQKRLKRSMVLRLITRAPFHVPEIMRFRKRREQGIMVEPSPVVEKWMCKEPIGLIKRYRDTEYINLLNEYRRTGGMVIVYSDYPAKEKIDALELEFDVIYDPRHGSFKSLKPNLETLKCIMAEQMLLAEEILYIGDRYEKDGECAKRCGIEFIYHKAVMNEG